MRVGIRVSLTRGIITRLVDPHACGNKEAWIVDHIDKTVDPHACGNKDTFFVIDGLIHG